METESAFECLGETYTICRLLGKGKGGYSYLAESEGGRKAVFKQMHYEPCDTYTFEDNKLRSELRDYQTLTAVGITIPKLLDFNDEKQYLVKEYIDGPTVAELVAQDRLEDECAVQMLHMCRLLYAAGLNVDYFPTNFVVEDGGLYYIDFECNLYMEEWDFEHWGVYFWVNNAGWAKFMETGDHGHLSENAKPHKAGLEAAAARLLGLGGIDRL